ncbi:Major facilitator superfamily (MFS) profile domain-containing protein [uncultured Gammaproteobacteria bacterium]
MPSAVRVIGLMLLAEIASMAGSSSYPVVLPELMRVWGLSPADAGWIGGAYFIGYVVAVPVLVGITDRLDARLVYFGSCAVSALASLGLGLTATGPWSAAGLLALQGGALAGTYMPGLRIMTERLPDGARLRAVPYYTSSFGIGVSLSFLIAGWAAHDFGWPAAFLTGVAGALIAIVLALAAVAGIPRTATAIEDVPSPGNRRRHLLDFRPVLTNRGVLAFILAYGGHCWELFALRSWVVAFLVFVAGHTTQTGAVDPLLSRWATAIILIGVPASILGAELALRIGRERLILAGACGAVVVGIACGLADQAPFGVVVALLLVFNTLIMVDSGAMTAGALDRARTGEQGATMAVYSLIGFAGGALGPVAVGLVLSVAGGADSAWAWTLALATMAAGSALAVLAMVGLGDAPLPNSDQAEDRTEGGN